MIFLNKVGKACHSSKYIFRFQVNPDATELAAVNLLICLVGRYFSQTDLAD